MCSLRCRIIRMYSSDDRQTPFVLVKWYVPSEHGGRQLVFDDVSEEDVEVKRIVSGALVFDSLSEMGAWTDQHGSVGGETPDAFYCEQGNRMDERAQRELFLLSDAESNARYWRTQQAEQARLFDAGGARRSSTNTTSSNTSSTEEKREAVEV